MHVRGAVIAVTVIALSACSVPSRHTAPALPRPHTASTAPPAPDPKTAVALVRIAQVFNNDYDSNDDGPVWDRWDTRSQAVISRADYIRRHAACSAPQGAARVEGTEPGPHGAWLVYYELGGLQFTDYWFFIGHRWEFDLLSNPAAARLYRLPFARYAAQTGCRNH